MFAEEFADFGVILGIGYGLSPAGGAGQFSYVELSPAGATSPTYHTVITGIESSAVSYVRASNTAQGGAGVNVFTVRPRDTDWVPGTWGTAGWVAPVGGRNVGNVAAPTGLVIRRQTLNVTYTEPIVLRAGSGAWISCENAAANSALEVIYHLLWVPTNLALA